MDKALKMDLESRGISEGPSGPYAKADLGLVLYIILSLITVREQEALELAKGKYPLTLHGHLFRTAKICEQGLNTKDPGTI